MKSKYGIAISILLITIFYPSLEKRAFAQSDEQKTPQKIRSASKNIRQGGWAIPKTRYTPNKKSVKDTIDGIEVQRRSVTPYARIVDYENYFIQSNSELTISSQKRRLDVIVEISVKGKVFAYEVTYSPYLGENINVTGIFEVFYVDNDGDGLFEERLHAIELKTVPKWVSK